MSDCRKCEKFEECAVDEDCGLFVAKPLTNADHIRTMTDEEIEDWYWWMHKEMMRHTVSRVFVHDWLKSPVDVEDAPTIIPAEEGE